MPRFVEFLFICLLGIMLAPFALTVFQWSILIFWAITGGQ